MKYTANALTVSRMVFAPLLLLLLSRPTIYIVCYALCGLSDVLDGLIARKTGTQSALGARLDSAADMLMFAAIAVSLLVWGGPGLLQWWALIAGVALLRLLNPLIAWIRYHAFVPLHTWGNKLSGILVFLSPVAYLVWRGSWVVPAVCIICALTALEETAIHLTAKTADPDRRGLFLK